MNGPLPMHLRERAVPLMIFFIAYLTVSLLSGFLYHSLAISPLIILSPAGIALAAVILEGYVALIPIALATALAALMSSSADPLSLYFALTSVAGKTAEAGAGLYILRRLRFDHIFFRLNDMFAIVFVSLFIATMVPSVKSVGILIADRYFGSSLQTHWGEWYLGTALSLLVLGTFLIRWIGRPVTPRTPIRYLETSCALTLLLVSSYLVFFTPYSTIGSFSLAYLNIVALFWLALRGGVRFTTLGLFAMTVLSFLGALYGTHAVSALTPAQRIFNTQVYDLILGIFFFVLVSIEEQRGAAQKALALHAQKLEDTLDRISLEDVAKNEFIALLGHELRNPLASLLSSVEVMKVADPSVDERKELLDTMDDRIRSMAYLLDDILDISRITARKFVMRRERMNAYNIARRAIHAVEPMMRKQRHTLVISFPQKSISLEGDPTRIEQIMVNLLHNSAKYTPPGGHIEFSGSYESGTLVIRVTDSGIGIPREMITRIFEPFVQINAKINRAGGIGIGLSLTKSLVELHAGSIDVESAGSGKGSTFTVRLPATLEEQDETVSARDRTQPRGTPHLDILIVDDNEEAARGLGKLLQLRRHHVSLAYSGERAVDAALSDKPDLIILDIGLPDISGLEVASRLRSANVPAVLVALSGYGQEDDRRKATEAGFDYHLTKPAGLAELEPLIAKITRS